jgi:undecaprenyl-diphosphatase
MLVPGGYGSRILVAVLLIVIGVSVTVASASMAVRGVSAEEEAGFRAVNGLTDAVSWPVRVAMQFGTYVTTPILAFVLWVGGRRSAAVAVFVAGTGAWLAAKVVKVIARRGRPAHALESGVRVRGRTPAGRGFPSGHAAVSAALAMILSFEVGGWAGGVAVLLAAITSFGRMYVGAHLPLDIVGGVGIGLTVGGTVLIAV